LPQPPLSARTRTLTSALTFKVISAADAAIAVPLPPLNADADAAVAASSVIAVIHCRPCHLKLIVASAIIPHCPRLAATSPLPFVADIKLHSSPPWSLLLFSVNQNNCALEMNLRYSAISSKTDS
jgi:hypothetical protein